MFLPAGIALVGASARLAQSFSQLYKFWESLREAPGEVEVIKNDLMLLANVLGDISKEVDLSPSVALTLEACQAKVGVSSSSMTPREVNKRVTLRIHAETRGDSPSIRSCLPRISP